MSTEARHSEFAFETVIEAHLLQYGYGRIPAESFDRERAIFPETILAFIRETQPAEWKKLEALHGDKTGEQVLTDLCKWMDTNGSLATLRHGFKCYGRSLRVAYFRAAHELNPELEARYAANRLGLTRQLHFSPRSEKSVDVTLSLNGIPVLTIELKNPMTGQTVEDACRQYKQDRDPWEPIFEFKRRTLAHFAADTESVMMTTRLAGSPRILALQQGMRRRLRQPARSRRTHLSHGIPLGGGVRAPQPARSAGAFRPFADGGEAGRSGPQSEGRFHDFPPLPSAPGGPHAGGFRADEGVGHNYLVEHSAGSGKSNTIGWLAHRLASLHNAASERVFDSVIVVTDRVVLDKQLQDTIYQFDHKRGVVQKIDESSGQLAEALEKAVPVIITTLQKFPFVSRHLLKMAEKRGKPGTGDLPTRHCAVIIDEAHSSQGGESATDLKEVLGGERLARRGKEAGGGGGPTGDGGTVPQHGEARQAG